MRAFCANSSLIGQALAVTIARLIDQSRGHGVALRQQAVIHPFRGGAPADVLARNPAVLGKTAKTGVYIK